MKEINEDIIAETAKKLIEDVTTVRDLKGITDGEMEAVYSLGFNFYNTGRIEDAEKVFKFLVLFDHMNPKYWTGMGAVQQVKREYEAAVTSYGFASFLDLENPKPQFHAAECYLAMGDRTNALSALAALAKFAPDTEEGRAYRAKGEELGKRIESLQEV